MGLRGPGSSRLKAAREALPERKRALPWERKGLSRPQRVIAFLQSLPITKGILAGTKMKLLPDQREFVERVYGDLRADGRRKIALAVKSAPKGSGKTGLTAGLGLCHLLGPEAEERGEIYSAAVDRGQASIIFNEMTAVIERVPEFAVRCNVKAHENASRTRRRVRFTRPCRPTQRRRMGWRRRCGFLTSWRRLPTGRCSTTSWKACPSGAKPWAS